MIPFDSHHDTGSKLLLNGVTLPAGGTTQADTAAAVQNIFNHPERGPVHLQTAHPAPGDE